MAARFVLADLPLKAFLAEAVVPYEIDEVTRLIVDEHDHVAFATISALTVGAFREWLLSNEVEGSDIAVVAAAITPEMAAAVSKLMRNQDLIAVARKISVVTRFRNTIGLPGRLAVRLQPNHPTDDPAGIAASVLDGLLMGAGDAVIGINPASDNVETTATLLSLLDEVRMAYDIPTQSCVLAHVTTTLDLVRRGAPVDLCFQSIAGTQAANRSFGIDLALLAEARDATLSLGRGTVGTDVMYFETGQGSCLSADAHHGVDQQTLEARAYAVAANSRRCSSIRSSASSGPNISTTASRFRAPRSRIIFAASCLACRWVSISATPIMPRRWRRYRHDPDAARRRRREFHHGVPGADDIMLNYQSTSFHDALYLREVLGLKPAPEFEAWLEGIGLRENGRIVDRGPLALEASQISALRQLSG